MKTINFILTILLCTTQFSKGYNILFFHAMTTSSHRTAIWPLAEKLADVGHNVTYIFPITKKVGSHPMVKEIVPSKMVPLLTELVADFDINLRLENRVHEWMKAMLMKSLEICEAFYESPEVQEWLSQPDLSFDLILIDGSLGECGYGLVHRFNSKHILFLPFMIPFVQDAFGIVPESSSVPEMLFHVKPTEMYLRGRLKTTIIPLLWRYKVEQYFELVHPIIKRGLNVSDLPPLNEFEKNTSLVFINNYFVEDYPLSMPPMFVSFSGLWCSKEKLRKKKRLPENISKFVENSEGFFYISFGSATVASGMPITMRNHFFNAFRAFPKHKFLWRWTGPVPEDTPKNALLLSWFPQHDILAHPKLKAFMTQTGRPSTQEALCHGVPLITMPIFGDQDYNANRMEYLGATININIDTISEGDLKYSFQEMLENPKYRNKMKELSFMFRDRPLDPLENVLYWTEYVMRHNTSLLKPLAMHQTWYQRRLLDVYGAMLVIVLSFLITFGFAAFFILKFIVQIVVGKLDEKKKVE